MEEKELFHSTDKTDKTVKNYLITDEKIKRTFGSHSDYFTRLYVQDVLTSEFEELRSHISYVRIVCIEDRLHRSNPFIIKCKNVKITEIPLEQVDEITMLINIAKAELRYNNIMLLLVEIRYSTKTYFSFYKVKQ